MRDKLEMFLTSPNFRKAVLSKEEFELAEKIETRTKFKIGFFDILHMILSKKTRSILVTRDKKLLKMCKEYNINAVKPEEIIH